MKNSRILSISGLIGVIVFVIVVLVAASQFPGYSHAAEYMSNLGAIGQPSATTMTIGGFVVGLLMILFGIATLMAFKKDWKGLLGGILIMWEGLSAILEAIFPCEPGCNATEPILSEQIHNILGPVSFIGLSICIILWAFRFKGQKHWNGLWIYSLIAGIAGIVLFLIFGMSVGTPTVGIWQRLLKADLYIWLAIFSYKLWQQWEYAPFLKE